MDDILKRYTIDTSELSEDLRATMGKVIVESPELRSKLEGFLQKSKDVTAWLNKSPKNLRAFNENPLEVLTKFLPGLSDEDVLLKRARPVLDNSLIPVLTDDSEAMRLLEAMTSYIAQSRANADAFSQSPLAVLSIVGSPFSATARQQVQRALELVLGIVRVNLTPFAVVDRLASYQQLTLTKSEKGDSDGNSR